MCGIAGFLETNGRSGNRDLQGIVLGMTNRLRHRGPDDVGTWTDAEAGIALGHRRLSILDLSPEGHQPMRSACGRYMISFNGEIYNFRALRAELEAFGYAFRGHSDTEVMLSCISHWGLSYALKRFNGMFAFALWDRQERQLHLVCDRMGEKPLYYGWLRKAFAFGSELKALEHHPDFSGELNRDALALYLRDNRVPSPYSIYQGISKVVPGTIVTVARSEAGAAPTITPYWSVREAAEQGMANPFISSDREAAADLEALLTDAVKIRMEADVPLGAFLSGGVDSSTIVALMQAHSGQPVRTFTVGFEESAYNEAHEAKAVARHLGTAHTELYVTPGEALTVIPKLPILYDEPFGDSSQIPTFLIAQLARRDVTVALSGDGGDELFGGYTRYFEVQHRWNQVAWMPMVVRALVARGLRAMSQEWWEAGGRMLGMILPPSMRRGGWGRLVHALADLLETRDQEAAYLLLLEQWMPPASTVIGGSQPETILTDKSRWADLPSLPDRMMYLDMQSYLPDDILVKVDRASMGVGLEARVPLLDHRLVEFAWRLPLSMKMRHGTGKWLLRQVLYKYVPPALIDRPKMGFGFPVDAWLRGPLKEWGEALLDEKRLKDQGLLNVSPIREKWEQHLAGTMNWQHTLWNILMFQAWLEHRRRDV